MGSLSTFIGSSRTTYRPKLLTLTGFFFIYHMLCLQATYKESGSLLPMEMFYGSQLVLPGEFVAATDPLLVASFINALQDHFSCLPTQQTLHNLPASSASPDRMPNHFVPCHHVFFVGMLQNLPWPLPMIAPSEFWKSLCATFACKWATG